MARLAFHLRWSLPALGLLAACAAPFAETFPSPRRSPRPVAVAAAPGAPAQVPATYASSPGGGPYAPGPAYFAAPPPLVEAAPAPAGQAPAPAESSPPATWDRPIPEPPGAAAPAGRCENTCDLANDGECDDGREGAGSDLCMPGTDCADCGG